jgi:hypothetical protein
VFSHSSSSESDASEDDDDDDVSGVLEDALGQAVALRIEVPFFAGALKYQWYKNGVALKGATGERLPLTTADSAAGSYGVYSCAVSTSSGLPIPEADVCVHVERKGDVDEGASSGASGNTVRGGSCSAVSWWELQYCVVVGAAVPCRAASASASAWCA